MVPPISFWAITSKLHNEAEHVAYNKHLCQPSPPDQAVFLAVHGRDDAAQQHVNARSEERWRYEEEESLDDIGPQA